MLLCLLQVRRKQKQQQQKCVSEMSVTEKHTTKYEVWQEREN